MIVQLRHIQQKVDLLGTHLSHECLRGLNIGQHYLAYYYGELYCLIHWRSGCLYRHHWRWIWERPKRRVKHWKLHRGKKIWLIGKGSLIMNIGGRNIWERVGTNRNLLELRAAPWGLNIIVQKVAPRTL
jgi:hypothetical protein